MGWCTSAVDRKAQKRKTKTRCFVITIYSLSSALGDKRDLYGNERNQYAQHLIHINARGPVVIGDHGTIKTVPVSLDGGIS